MLTTMIIDDGDGYVAYVVRCDEHGMAVSYSEQPFEDRSIRGPMRRTSIDTHLLVDRHPTPPEPWYARHERCRWLDDRPCWLNGGDYTARPVSPEYGLDRAAEHLSCGCTLPTQAGSPLSSVGPALPAGRDQGDRRGVRPDHPRDQRAPGTGGIAVCDCPCHDNQREAPAECWCTPACIRGEEEPMPESTPESTPLPIPDDWWFAQEHHRPVCVLLRQRGIAAYEEGSGGGNFHVAFPRGDRFILADCNDGPWVAGRYVSHDDAYEGEYENEFFESDGLDEDSPPAAVVHWLLSVTDPGA